MNFLHLAFNIREYWFLCILLLGYMLAQKLHNRVGNQSMMKTSGGNIQDDMAHCLHELRCSRGTDPRS